MRILQMMINLRATLHNWKAKDIKAYCKEFWRGYIAFIKES